MAKKKSNKKLDGKRNLKTNIKNISNKNKFNSMEKNIINKKKEKILESEKSDKNIMNNSANNIKKNKKINSTIEKKTKFDFYKKNYKILMIIPAIMFILSIFFIYQTVMIEGTPIYRDISLKGGLSSIITIDTDIGLEEYNSRLKVKFNENSFAISEIFENGRRIGFIVDTDLDEKLFTEFSEEYFNTKFIFGENYSSNFISPSLSSSFFIQAIYILLISFVSMSIVIFAYFREFVPSFAVVLSAFFDVVVTVGILDLFGVKVSIAGIGSLLMLIGYSIDTDVLLTNRLLKEKGDDHFAKMIEAFKTGTLMTGTTLIAGFAALFISESVVIQEIALILVIGLLVDFISTWLQNTGLLLLWFEKKEN